MSIILSSKTENSNELDLLAINNIKSLAIDMITSANSGHPGIVLSAAPAMYTLYTRHINFDNKNDKWINRDRFVLSAGHGSALLYSTLFMCDFLSIEDLKKFRKLNSLTPGHPEYGITPGVDTTTGPLGQGIANAVGMAIAEKFLNNRYSIKKGTSLIDHYTYVLCSDGDLMEGVSYEACSIAGNLNLGKLIILYDSNNMTIDRNTNETLKENVLDRFKAMNFDVQLVKDGNNINEIDLAINKAKNVKNKPSIIEIKTILGNGSKLQNTNSVHGKPLDAEDISQLKKKLNMRDVMFTVYEEAKKHIENCITERNEINIKEWNKLFEKILEKSDDIRKNEINKLISNDYSISLDNLFFDKTVELNDSGRNISGILLNKLINENTLMLGGSADLATSTMTNLNEMKDFTANNLSGRNILFGVREHAMGGILNGICLSGIRCFGSTFLAFSDYMKPAIRLAAIMKLPIIYIFTHDSITIGEDGPTHQPVEQLIGLRTIPNVTVYRPFDANEILGAYKSAINNTNGPSVIVLNKNKINISSNTKIGEVDKGGYCLFRSDNPKGIIIATGEELQMGIDVYNKLKEIGVSVDLVSMPSLERFFLQPKVYQNKILRKVKRVAIEYASPYSWYKFVRSNKYIFGVNSFGKSGSKEDIVNEYKLDFDEIYKKTRNYFNKK